MSNVKPNNIGMDELPPIGNKPLPTLSDDINVRKSLEVPSDKKQKRRRPSDAGSDHSAGSRASKGRNKENNEDNLVTQINNNPYVERGRDMDYEPASLQRSFLLTNNDRHQLELQHLRPLKSGGGLSGKS